MATKTAKNEARETAEEINFMEIRNRSLSKRPSSNFWQQVSEDTYTFESVSLADVTDRPLNAYAAEYIKSDKYAGSDGFAVITATDSEGNGLRVRSGSRMFVKFANDCIAYWAVNPDEVIPFVALEKGDAYEIIPVSTWMNMKGKHE